MLAICATGMLPKDSSVQSYHNIFAAISFASMQATQLGDRLLAASFITSAAANLSVTLFIGEDYFLNNLSSLLISNLIISYSNVVVLAKSPSTKDGSARVKQLYYIFDVC